MPTGGEGSSSRALDLAMAKAHVAEFEVRVEAQEKLVAGLVEAGQVRDADAARHVLAEYHEALCSVRAHLRHLQEALAPVRGEDTGEGAKNLLRVAAP